MSEGENGAARGGAQGSAGKAKGKKTTQKAADFYASALGEAARIRLPRAKKLEGLDEEIALLRVRLMEQLEEHPENLELLLKGMNTLVRLVAQNYRLSPKSKDDLMESAVGVIDGIGRVLWPERFGEQG